VSRNHFNESRSRVAFHLHATASHADFLAVPYSRQLWPNSVPTLPLSMPFGDTLKRYVRRFRVIICGGCHAGGAARSSISLPDAQNGTPTPIELSRIALRPYPSLPAESKAAALFDIPSVVNLHLVPSIGNTSTTTSYVTNATGSKHELVPPLSLSPTVGNFPVPGTRTSVISTSPSPESVSSLEASAPATPDPFSTPRPASASSSVPTLTQRDPSPPFTPTPVSTPLTAATTVAGAPPRPGKWEGLEKLRDVLDSVADSSSPIKVVANGFIDCMEVFEVRVMVQFLPVL
jgi:hypothetical protein